MSGTVEEAIYEISVSRRLAHIAQKQQEEKDQETSSVNGTNIDGLTEDVIDSANSLELQDATFGNLLAATANEGERVNENDLWQCLFGKADKGPDARISEATQNEISRFLRLEAAERRRQDTIGNGIVTHGEDMRDVENSR